MIDEADMFALYVLAGIVVFSVAVIAGAVSGARAGVKEAIERLEREQKP